MEPKSAKSRRTLALPQITLEALEVQRGKQVANKLKAGTKWQESALVFTSRYGTPLNRHNVSRDFKSLLKRFGLTTQRFHDLRHSCATLLLARGVQMKDIQEVLGHSQIGLTMDTYSHFTEAGKQNAANQMDQLFAAS